MSDINKVILASLFSNFADKYKGIGDSIRGSSPTKSTLTKDQAKERKRKNKVRKISRRKNRL